MSSLQQLHNDHEAFKSRLVQEVLGTDTGDRVPMEKVVMLIWQFRDDPTVVTFMARFVAKYAGSRRVFDGIEFYLPQLAHMIIHLEVEWDDAILERFALVIAQQSLHFSLQFIWILQGALEDYHPELVQEDGAPNPKFHDAYYTRCCKLLKNLERCVVYGKPRAAELQRLYEKGNITKKELTILEQADRRFNALQITAYGDDHDQGAPELLDGTLYVKMPILIASSHGTSGATTTTPPASSEYVTRFCVLERSVLKCFHPPGSSSGCGKQKSGEGLQLDRAMALERSTVTAPTDKSLLVQTPLYSFTLGFPQVEEQKLWMRRLREEAEISALFPTQSAFHRTPIEEEVEVTHTTGDQPPKFNIKDDLTPDQLNRYEFFQNERSFVYDLTAIAEELRFCDRPERKKHAPGHMEKLKIPPMVYLPLCNSSDIWRRVHCALPAETRVFNTKERCPVIMNFVSKRGEENLRDSRIDPNLDVAEFMHTFLEVTPPPMGSMDRVPEEEVEMEVIQETTTNGNHATLQNGSLPQLRDEEDDDDNDDDPIKTSEHGSLMSNVWEDHAGGDEEEGQDGEKKRGNRKVQRLVRESILPLPAKLARRLKPNKGVSRRRVSIMDKQTEMQPIVPILEHQRGDDDNASVGDGTVVSVERSSILFKDTILFGDLDEGDIDLESIDRAKKYVCGGDSWAEKSARMLEKVRKQEGNAVQLEISTCLAKSNDDLRQEVFVMQMIHYFKSVFAQAKLPLWLRTYRILSTSSSTGLLEVLTDATSLDGLKKSEGYPTEGGLRAYFEEVYGGKDSISFKEAQTNFVHSLAGYAVVSYLLGLKDRHNGNIMIDTRGHLINIDFGFAMGMAPGNEFSFERAPFKLTKEYVELMDGVGSACYKEFERLFVAGMVESRKNSQIALGLVEIMMYKSNYPCFSGWRQGNGAALVQFSKRLLLHVPEDQVERKALRLVRKARQHFGTYLYDAFQQATNGYAI